MLLTQSVAILSGLIAPALALPQGQIRPRGSPDPAKAEAIKEAYQLSWKAYYDHAFPNDTLHPVSNSYENDR
jgi:mannosyl-oligosaccharide alpha-1,2-mannosidase